MYLDIELVAFGLDFPVCLLIYLLDQYYFANENSKQTSVMKGAFIGIIVAPLL